MRRSLYVQLLGALAISAVSLGIRELLDPLLEQLEPFATGFVAVAAAVWFLGWQAGITTALTVYFGAHYLFVEPRHTWSLTNVYDVSSFFTNLTASLVVIWMAHQARLARDKAIAANEQKDRFVAMVSHELRNPLGTMSNALAGLRQVKDATHQEAWVRLMERQTAQMTEILTDLLDVSRINRGQITINKTLVDLQTSVEEAVAYTRAAAERKGQRIVPDIGGPAVASVDRTRILQVLTNLLDNASKYSPADATIQVRLRPGDPTEIRICDDGPGIPKELLPHIFELNRPASTRSSETGGLGLGLPVCKKLVELHGGTIKARNRARGRGACFTVSLPPGNG
jgi:signal transduction histidine kinase